MSISARRQAAQGPHEEIVQVPEGPVAADIDLPAASGQHHEGRGRQGEQDEALRFAIHQ